MRLRKKFWPRSVGDALGVGFLLIMFPVCYWFHVFIALPLYFEGSQLLYQIHCGFSSLLLFLIVSNFLAVILVDTSTAGLILPSDLKPSWRFCSICESISPPRSWHCNVCESCILKRDHHCNFTACCIGHQNQRYFVMFVFYLSTSLLYTTYFNSYYLWRFTSFSSFYSALQLVLPLAVLVFGSDSSLIQLFRLICVISIVGTIASTSLLVYHVINLMKGITMYENNKNNSEYSMGSWAENLKLALGERWYLTFVSPFIASKLPHNGINWDELKLAHGKSK